MDDVLIFHRGFLRADLMKLAQDFRLLARLFSILFKRTEDFSPVLFADTTINDLALPLLALSRFQLRSSKALSRLLCRDRVSLGRLFLLDFVREMFFHRALNRTFNAYFQIRVLATSTQALYRRRSSRRW